MTGTTHYRIGRRLVWVTALCAGLLLLTLPLAQAQEDNINRQVAVGSAINATLDADNYAQVFTLAASSGDTITIDVSTEDEALAPVVMVTDQRGNLVVQDSDQETATTATLADVSIPATGTYYIIVMRGSGAEGDASGTFTLRLSGVQQVGGQSVALEDGGIAVELGWNAAVDLNLEVRDPVGGTVHAFNQGSPSGGTLDADTNVNCDTATADNPAETVAWPTGQVPAGSYEIIVHYMNGCDVGGPQEFNIATSVSGETAQTLSGTLNPSQKYLARLIVDADGAWRLENGGVNAGLDVTLFNSDIANAQPVAVGTTITGQITNADPAQAYTFDATSGTTVNIAAVAQNGSLDTFLALLGPDNTTLVTNDDLEDSTNSTIQQNLTVDGTYTVLVTRYGLTIGGTEGEYTLTVGTGGTTGEVTPGTTPVPADGTEDTSAALPEGFIEVSLTWLTNADLQLLVRDPAGDSVFDDEPQGARSGGILDQDGNRNCTDTTTTPVSYIYWPPARMVQGVYEVEVWFQSSCNDNTPVNFALTVNVQNQTVINTTNPISQDARYMITFTVASDGTATAGPGDFFNMETAASLNYQDDLETATPITYDSTVSGSITGQQEFVVYSFEGENGDAVTISMTGTGGTLDPALYLIEPSGTQIDFNDDIVASGESRNPNSSIQNKTLAFTGTYYIIATHYGLNVGGTEGTFNLSLVQE